MKIRILLVLVVLTCSLFGQTTQFNLDEYSTFLQNNQNIQYEGLTSMFPAGIFRDKAVQPSSEPLYIDSIKLKYNLTQDEIGLLNQNGFMVSERLTGTSFGQQLLDIWHADMPVFVSTDMILHALHRSYDMILKDVEVAYLVNKLNQILSEMHGGLSDLETNYSSQPEMNVMLKDVDVYLTVALKLLNETAQPYFAENESLISEYMDYIANEQFVTLPLFADSTSRMMDFSQFKVRGHYDDEQYPELARYFKSMIWLGRTELYLNPPKNSLGQYYAEDHRRQVIDAFLLRELAQNTEAKTYYQEFENVISLFVGEQDNVTLDNMNSLFDKINLTKASDLFDDNKFEEFTDTLASQPFSDQLILSQCLVADPFKPDSLKPASAFMLLGQRFVVDSYITGNVVYGKIDAFRMLPKTLDILFAAGNDASAQLLKSEIEQYNYAPNLAALRYLIDSYGEDFWGLSLYNSWLNAIRELNPPDEKGNLPAFMQTGAWWQQKMNTQLASWTELRHDNLLYAKQSYTGIPICSYPYSYVEPFPEFYQSLQKFAEKALQGIETIELGGDYASYMIPEYFENFIDVMSKLAVIAQKELDGTEFSVEEKEWLKEMVFEGNMCGAYYGGWYYDLYYMGFEEFMKSNYLVADYHTSPADENGTIVGWVAHAGTGPVDLMVVNAELPGVGPVAFIGPVMSYYEYLTTGFERLTDQEWEDTYMVMAERPEWVNTYLADENGNRLPQGLRLATGIEESEGNLIPETHLIARNYPNPFNPSTYISFTIPAKLTGAHTTLRIYDIRGELVAELLNENLQSGNYTVRWNGTNGMNQRAASGVYLYNLRAGSESVSGKMTLLK